MRVKRCVSPFRVATTALRHPPTHQTADPTAPFRSTPCRPLLLLLTLPALTSSHSSKLATTSALRRRSTTLTTPSGGEAGQEVVSLTQSGEITDAPATLASSPATRSSGPADMQFSGRRLSQTARWSPQPLRVQKSSMVRDLFQSRRATCLLTRTPHSSHRPDRAA